MRMPAIHWTDVRGALTKLEHINAPTAEVYLSTNPKVGTLRGLHYEIGEGARQKYVYCIRGRIWDIGVKVRTGAMGYETLGPGDAVSWLENIAHGFITLEPDTEILYLMSKPYRHELTRGLRWNDPKLNIPWPIQPTIISERDRNFPDWSQP